MATDKKPIECIVKFDPKGNIEPMRFRFEDKEGQHVIQITNIIEKDVKNGFGTMNGNAVKQFSFKCESLLEGLAVHYKLTFDNKNCLWYLVMD